MPKSKTQVDTSVLGSKKAWFTVALAGTFYSYQFIIRVFPNVLNNEIMTTLGIDAAAFGLMVGFYYWTYSGMQIPLGITMDRFGPRMLLSLAGLVCGLACFIFSLTTNFYVASFARFIMGLGAASGLLGTIKLGTMWFPPHKIGSVIALAMVFGTLGAASGGPPLRLLIEWVGWQTSLQLLGCEGLAISIIIFLFVRNTPHGDELPKSEGPKENMFAGLKMVLKSPQAWFISGFSALMYAPMIIMGDAWSVPFMVSIYGMSKPEAALFNTFLFVGAAVGSPFFTLISDRLRSRRIPMYAGGLIALSVYMTIVFVHDINLYAMYMLFFIAGFSYTAKCLCFASMTEIMPPASSGVSVGFSNMLVMLCGAFYHPIVGIMLELHWNGLEVGGVPIYNETDYRYALTLIPIFLSLSLFFLGFIKETHPARPHRLND